MTYLLSQYFPLDQSRAKQQKNTVLGQSIQQPSIQKKECSLVSEKIFYNTTMTHHNYIFLTSDYSFAGIETKKQKEYKKEFQRVLESERNVVVHAYAMLGLKANTALFLWFQADTIDVIQNLLNALMHTNLGKYLRITHTLFGMTRPTQYSSRSTRHLDATRKGRKDLIIYPFTQTK